MLIEKYDLEIFTPPCDPGAERFAVTAHLTGDISEVLPYLNVTLSGAAYHRAAKALTWKNGGHSIAIHAYRISMSNMEDRDIAENDIKELVNLINSTWERRAEITPSYEIRQRPAPMDVYKLLPQTNCMGCGDQTCFTFALNLVASEKKLIDCPPLFEPQYAENLSALQDIIIEALDIE